MWTAAAAAAKSLQSCPTLCNPIDGSPPGSPVPGTLQARTLEWIAISSSNAWKWKVKAKPLSRVWLAVTPGTAAHQAPSSMGFSRWEYWSGMPLPSPNLWTLSRNKWHVRSLISLKMKTGSIKEDNVWHKVKKRLNESHSLIWRWHVWVHYNEQSHPIAYTSQGVSELIYYKIKCIAHTSNVSLSLSI